MVADSTRLPGLSLASYSNNASNYNRNYWPDAEFSFSSSKDLGSLPEPIPSDYSSVVDDTSEFETEYFPVLWSMLFGDAPEPTAHNKVCPSPSSVVLHPPHPRPISLETQRTYLPKLVVQRSSQSSICRSQSCEKITQLGTHCTKHGGRRICNVEGCKRVDRGRGLCGTHGGGRRCKVLGCEKASRKHGLCSAHYRQANQ